MKTLIYIEKNPVNNKIREVSMELTAKAFDLMQSLDGEVIGAFIGDRLPENTEELFKYGMDHLIHLTDERLQNLQSMVVKNVLSEIIRQQEPDIVLFGATHNGRDIAPLVASYLKTGLTADCTQLKVEDYKDKGKILYQIRPAFGGNIIATIVTPEDRPMMATVREGVMPLPATTVDNPVNVEKLNESFDEDLVMNEFLSVVHKEEKVNLNKADIVVSGGAGVGSAENFKLLHDLAEALGGDVGASRAAVDFGYADKSRQVGQTGTVVRPKLYIACGISGQVQHRAGMEDSKKIIAINKDPNAPIFNIAHKGIVGDLNEVIPTMLHYLKEEE
ncbi:MAG TPA: electron transfer flavoprotein subunit alpha/FixB family protein [bacterium]|nr:electron transfer flavoprotein subunit alpha/FixB family protein [bacterium]